MIKFLETLLPFVIIFIEIFVGIMYIPRILINDGHCIAGLIQIVAAFLIVLDNCICKHYVGDFHDNKKE